MLPIGVLIHAGGPSPAPYFTPWAGRGGNAAVFVADIIALNLTASGFTPKVVITVQTKNSEDVDSTTTSQDVGSFADITGSSPTPPTKYLSEFKELYRYKIVVKGDPGVDWVHMRMLTPSWLPN